METIKKLTQDGVAQDIFLHNGSKAALLIKQGKDLLIVNRNNVDQLIAALTEFKTYKIKKCDFTRQSENGQTINCKKDGCKRCNS